MFSVHVSSTYGRARYCHAQFHVISCTQQAWCELHVLDMDYRGVPPAPLSDVHLACKHSEMVTGST